MGPWWSASDGATLPAQPKPCWASTKGEEEEGERLDAGTPPGQGGRADGPPVPELVPSPGGYKESWGRAGGPEFLFLGLALALGDPGRSRSRGGVAVHI